MGVVERVADLRDDAHDEFERQRLGLLEQELEVRAPHVLHRDEADPGFRFVDDVVDGDDVRVREDARALRLAHEAAAELLELLVLGREAGAERLEGHEPPDQRIPGEVDDPHRTLAKLLEDLVAA